MRVLCKLMQTKFGQHLQAQGSEATPTSTVSTLSQNKHLQTLHFKDCGSESFTCESNLRLLFYHFCLFTLSTVPDRQQHRIHMVFDSIALVHSAGPTLSISCSNIKGDSLNFPQPAGSSINRLVDLCPCCGWSLPHK